MLFLVHVRTYKLAKLLACLWPVCLPAIYPSIHSFWHGSCLVDHLSTTPPIVAHCDAQLPTRFLFIQRTLVMLALLAVLNMAKCNSFDGNTAAVGERWLRWSWSAAEWQDKAPSTWGKISLKLITFQVLLLYFESLRVEN